MYQVNEFSQRSELDQALAKQVADILTKAVSERGKASIAVSGGSTPKGFFNALSMMDLPWSDITVTLADERWVEMSSDDSNTKLVFENLLQNKATKAKFFHLKQGSTLNQETLADLNIAAKSTILPLDVLILGMGEDGHTASLFPCSDQIDEALAKSTGPLLKVVPKTAPYERITFSYIYLKQSKHTFLHISGAAKKTVLNQALAGNDVREMPIRAFLQDPDLTTQVYWAE